MNQTLSPCPAWLFSMDSALFWAVPTTTGGLKAYYQHYGRHTDHYRIELNHFRDSDALVNWRAQWRAHYMPQLQSSLARGQRPVIGFSFYTWNAAEFLELIGMIKADCPDILCIAGGPHVQQAEDYLFDDPIDIIVLGEGEQTFQELLDGVVEQDWRDTPGIAYLEGEKLVETAPRARRQHLDELPSALEVVPLTDDQGQPLYSSISYETSRGCPYKCAFYEWGTGAIGGKMYQFSLARIERDWRQIIAAGIKDIWLADSNFGALREDLDKARLICELKAQTGLPGSFATSWSKKHSPRVQEIVLLLHAQGLLPHYQLALQTLTPLALELSNRKNMAANKYQPIARQMARQGIPIAAELIWGLPGDNLPDFEKNLDQLLQTFPTLNIFAYTLLPGTEFYAKRDEYRIETIPVAGYGKAKGEYVVACHSFDRQQGLQGYMLITAYMLFAHGHILPLTIRFLAMQEKLVTATVLRSLLHAVCRSFRSALPGLNPDDPLSVYEQRAGLFTEILRSPEQLYDCLKSVLESLLPSSALWDTVSKVMMIDRAFAPRWGERTRQYVEFSFDALAVKQRLDSLEPPDASAFESARQQLFIDTPGGVGIILHDPDGGAWLQGEIVDDEAAQSARLIHPTVRPTLDQLSA